MEINEVLYVIEYFYIVEDMCMRCKYSYSEFTDKLLILNQSNR